MCVCVCLCVCVFVCVCVYMYVLEGMDKKQASYQKEIIRA